jgi:hypothetical protein
MLACFGFAMNADLRGVSKGGGYLSICRDQRHPRCSPIQGKLLPALRHRFSKLVGVCKSIMTSLQVADIYLNVLDANGDICYQILLDRDTMVIIDPDHDDNLEITVGKREDLRRYRAPVFFFELGNARPNERRRVNVEASASASAKGLNKKG